LKKIQKRKKGIQNICIVKYVEKKDILLGNVKNKIKKYVFIVNKRVMLKEIVKN